MNKKMKVLITFILVCLFVIAAIVGVWYYKTKFYIPDKGGMERDIADTVVSCSYSCGGGMDGSSMSVRIYLNENNEVWFEYYNLPYPGAEEETKSYQIEYEAIEKIRRKCKEYGVLRWGELKVDKFQAQLLDAPTTHINFIYGDNEYYSVSSSDELPGKGKDFFSVFYEIIDQYNTQGGS